MYVAESFFAACSSTQGGFNVSETVVEMTWSPVSKYFGDWIPHKTEVIMEVKWIMNCALYGCGCRRLISKLS